MCSNIFLRCGSEQAFRFKHLSEQNITSQQLENCAFLVTRGAVDPK